MTIRVCLAGATGWAGSAVASAMAGLDDITLASAVSRTHAGKTFGAVLGEPRLTAPIHATAKAALAAQPCDVFFEFTKPDVAKSHVLTALQHKAHVVVGTSGLSDADYAEIASAAREAGCGVPWPALIRPTSNLAPAQLAQLAAAESEIATARAERKRYAGLDKQKFVSSTAFEAKDNAYNNAQARLAQAQAQSRISGNQAAYGTLSSDKPAVVTAVLADAGQVVSAGQAVMRLARSDEKEVLIAVPESKLATLKRGGNVAVNLWAEPKNLIQGRIREISPAADAATRSFLVRVQLINPPLSVQLGMTARVLVGETHATPLLVPLTALTDHGQGPQVWVVEDGKATPRKVHITQFREDGAAIDSGLQEGERVMISGLNRLTPGMAVTTKVAAAPAEQR